MTTTCTQTGINIKCTSIYTSLLKKYLINSLIQLTKTIVYSQGKILLTRFIK